MSPFTRQMLLLLANAMQYLIDWDPAPATDAKLKELKEGLQQHKEPLKEAVANNQP